MLWTSSWLNVPSRATAGSIALTRCVISVYITDANDVRQFCCVLFCHMLRVFSVLRFSLVTCERL